MTSNSPNNTDIQLTEFQKMRLDYFQKHALPWQMEHIKFRGLGIQVFVAIQGALFIAWSNKPIFALPIFALVSCLSFWFWDSRNRFIIGQVHTWGREIADSFMFPLKPDGTPSDGVHVKFGGTLKASGETFPPTLAELKSHTWAVLTLLIAATALWFFLLLAPIVSNFLWPEYPVVCNSQLK